MSRRTFVAIAVAIVAVVAGLVTVPRFAFADTNLALGKPVTVSSTDDPVNAAANAVDGTTFTRWSSAYSDPQWIVGLGASYTISSVRYGGRSPTGGSGCGDAPGAVGRRRASPPPARPRHPVHSDPHPPGTTFLGCPRRVDTPRTSF
jgi:hypothetical protein